MINEAEERELYLKIKNSFSGIKGTSIFIEVDDKVFIKPTIHYIENDQDFSDKVDELQERKMPYAVFDYSEESPGYCYFGTTFFQTEVLATGEVTTNCRRHKIGPIEMARVKEELKLLGELLRNSKVS